MKSELTTSWRRARHKTPLFVDVDEDENTMAGEILVYGTDWCALTYRVREYLMNARVAYQYFDIDRDPDAQDVMLSLTDGRRSFPLVVVERRIVIDATIGELQRVLDEHDIRPQPAARRATDERTWSTARSKGGLAL